MTAPLLRIRQKLETVLSERATALGLTVLYENVTPLVEPESVSPYWIECFLMPGRPINPTMGDSHVRHVGLFQVDVHFKKGEGLQKVTEIADDIANTFSRGNAWSMNDLNSAGASYDAVLSVMDSPSIDNVDIAVDYKKMVVTIYYQCDVFYSN